MNVGGFVVLGSAFGSFAGLIAFVITYDEHSRHYSDRKQPLKLALEMAVVAFVVFLVLSVVTGIVLTGMYMSQ